MSLVEQARELSKNLLSPYRAEHAHRVAMLLKDATDAELAAAYLHDILEDTNTKEEILLKQFGEEVTLMVKMLTNPFSVYHSRVRDFGHLKGASVGVKKIKLADRIDNIEKRVYGVDIYNCAIYADYAQETENLLEILKDADAVLANILGNLIIKLRNGCAKYKHGTIL